VIKVKMAVLTCLRVVLCYGMVRRKGTCAKVQALWNDLGKLGRINVVQSIRWKRQ